MPKPNQRPEGFPGAEKTILRVGHLFEAIDYDVDWIPPSWDLELTHVSHGVTKIDYEAQRILALLLAWYRPGAHGKPRFSGGSLNVSYDQLMARFRVSKKDAVGKVLSRMEGDHGVIVRHSGGLGKGMGAFLEIAPVMDRVEAITYPVQMSPKTGRLVPGSEGTPVSGGPYYIPTVRHHGIAPTGLITREDEDYVHVLSLQRRVDLPHPTEDRSQPELPTGRRLVTSAAESVADETDTDGESGDIWFEDSEGSASPDSLRAPLRSTASSSTRDVSAASDDAEAADLTTGRPADRKHPHEVGGASRSPAANALAPEPTAARRRRDSSLERHLDLFRQQCEGELWRVKRDKNAQRAVVRRALRDAACLLRGDTGTAKLAGWVRNAWDRLDRAGSQDPAVVLLGVAVFACGRVTGPVETRVATVHSLIDAVSRQAPLSCLATNPIPGEVQMSLRRAFLHRLDADNVVRLVRRVCKLRDEPQTYQFTNALVRLFATREIPFNSPLFASACVSAVQAHVVPEAADLLRACACEARKYPAPQSLSSDEDEHDHQFQKAEWLAARARS